MSIRHLVKYFAGGLFSTILVKRAKTVKKSFTLPEASSLSNNIVNRLIRYYYASKLTSDSAEKTHRQFWENQTSGQWFKRTDNRLYDLYIPTYQDYIEKVKLLLPQQHVSMICEWGVGNGSWLNYLNGQFASLEKFIGVDISSSQIMANEEQYPDLDFHQADIVEWTRNNIEAKTLYHTNSGILEYLSQQSVVELFDIVSSKEKTALFLIEPIEKNHDLSTQTNSFLHGNEYSYSHNLPHLVKKAGFSILFQEETALLNCRMLVIFAVNK